MELINISELKSHPENAYYFDDIQGDSWIDFKKSIKDRTVIEPIIITQDRIIVSGHQRVRACKELGLNQIKYEMINYDNNNEILIDLIETNIKQRGFGNPNHVKLGRCIVKLEEFYGIKNGGSNFGGNQFVKKELENNFKAPKTQEDLSRELDVTSQQLNNYKKLTTLIPELQNLISDKQLSATTGYKVWAKMSQGEQEKFFNEIGKDKLASMTQKETQQYIDKAKRLEQENLKLKTELQQEKNKPPKTEYKEKTIDNTDYEGMKNLEQLKKDLESKTKLYDIVKDKEENYKIMLEGYKKDSEEYNKIKNKMLRLNCIKGGDYDEVKAYDDVNNLYLKIDTFIKSEISPVQYEDCLRFLNQNEYIADSFVNMVKTVQKWCDDMMDKLDTNNKNNIINVEVM